MTELYEHNPGDHEDPLPGPTFAVGIAGVVLLLVSVLAVATMCYSIFDATRTERFVEPPRVEVRTLESAQRARLEGPVRRELRPENPEGEESLVIPIDRAMELLVRDSRPGAG